MGGDGGEEAAMLHSCSQHALQSVASLLQSPVDIIERVQEMASLLFIFINNNVNRTSRCSSVT